MDIWRNECVRKMDDLPDHTTTNNHPLKMDVRPTTFLQIILAAKWIVRHASTSI